MRLQLLRKMIIFCRRGSGLRAGGRPRGSPWVVALAIAASLFATVHGSRAPLASTASPSRDLLPAGWRREEAAGAHSAGRQACRGAGAAGAVLRPSAECGLLRLRGGMLIYKDAGARPQPRARAPVAVLENACAQGAC